MDARFGPSMMQANMMRLRKQGRVLLIDRMYLFFFFLHPCVVVGTEVRSTSPEHECIA